jgi:hypothetical protein
MTVPFYSNPHKWMLIIAITSELWGQNHKSSMIHIRFIATAATVSENWLLMVIAASPFVMHERRASAYCPI